MMIKIGIRDDGWIRTNLPTSKKHYALSLWAAVSLSHTISSTLFKYLKLINPEVQLRNESEVTSVTSVCFLGGYLGFGRLYPVAITVQRRTIKDIILQNYHVPTGVSVQAVALSYFYSHKLQSAHEIFRGICCYSSLTFNSPLRHWSRPVFTPWGGVQRCLTIRSALSLSDGPAAERRAKEQQHQASAPWRLGLGRDNVSGGGSLRTRCSSLSCMWVTANIRRRRERGNRGKDEESTANYLHS